MAATSDSNSASPPIIVVTTVRSIKAAHSLSKVIIDASLGACIHISPVTSVYSWKGKLETESEVKLSIKTIRSREADLYALIKALHPYEQPELITLPILNGDSGYLNWLTDCCDG